MAFFTVVDIETLGLKPTSKILSIGLVIVNHDSLDIKLEKEWIIDPLNQKGRTVDRSTIEWWNRQSEAAKSVLNQPTQSLVSALTELSELITKTETEGEIKGQWANDADFDHVILRNAYDQNTELDGNTVFPYYLGRSIRTIKDYAKEVKLTLPKHTYIQHRALDDARHEAELVINYYRHVRRTA